MAKSKNLVFKDSGEGNPSDSLQFAKDHLEDLSQATFIKAVQNSVASSREWGQFNVRFTTPLGQEFHFSGLNIGYKGSGPQTFIKVMKLINWTINPDVVFINSELQIARELPSDKKKKPKKKEGE